MIPTRHQAEQLAATLPPLMAAAERVAAAVAHGVHGRRRVGMGESFWQFRPFVPGDAVARIDWRRSARADHQVYVRETEWEAAQTVALWVDAAPGMAWRSAPELATKRERAALLALALASLLLRGGERVRLLDGLEANAAGGATLSHLADALARGTPGLPDALPPARAAMVLFSDFLAEPAGLRDVLGRYAAMAVRGVLVQVLDPAEIELPYVGRVRFRGVGHGPEVVVARAEAVREAYRERLAERQAEVAGLARAAGFAVVTHRSDSSAAAGLAELYGVLSSEPSAKLQ